MYNIQIILLGVSFCYSAIAFKKQKSRSIIYP